MSRVILKITRHMKKKKSTAHSKKKLTDRKHLWGRLTDLLRWRIYKQFIKDVQRAKGRHGEPENLCRSETGWSAKG